DSDRHIVRNRSALADDKNDRWFYTAQHRAGQDIYSPLGGRVTAMLGAIYIGLSGMDAYEKGLQTISNNVANLNTAGFKSTSVSFNDLFSYGGGGSSLSNSSAGNPAG